MRPSALPAVPVASFAAGSHPTAGILSAAALAAQAAAEAAAAPPRPRVDDVSAFPSLQV